MPCVLPVLSLKLLGLVQHGDGDPWAARAGFLASATGIIAAFLVLAGALASLKAGGMVVGWGIQFQQPWFLIGLALLDHSFRLQSLGLLRVAPTTIDFRRQHPRRQHQRAGRTFSARGLRHPAGNTMLSAVSWHGRRVRIGRRHSGHIPGVRGFGPRRGASISLIAAFPKTATWLPKPGTWVVKLKIVLGFALAATGAWILTILAGTAGATAAWIVAGLMAASGGVLYWAHKLGHAGVKLSAPALLAAFLVATATPHWLSQSTGQRRQNQQHHLATLR